VAANNGPRVSRSSSPSTHLCPRRRHQPVGAVALGRNLTPFPQAGTEMPAGSAGIYGVVGTRSTRACYWRLGLGRGLGEWPGAGLGRGAGRVPKGQSGPRGTLVARALSGVCGLRPPRPPAHPLDLLSRLRSIGAGLGGQPAARPAGPPRTWWPFAAWPSATAPCVITGRSGRHYSAQPSRYWLCRSASASALSGPSDWRCPSGVSRQIQLATEADRHAPQQHRLGQRTRNRNSIRWAFALFTRLHESW